MFNINKLLGLSPEGGVSLRRATVACALSNLSLLVSSVIALQIITALLEPLASGAALDIQKLLALLAAALGGAALYFFAYRNQYHKTYTAAYTESEKMRINVAEHIRRLPLSFFNNKDLAELTTNIMGDCTSIEHTMSHVVPDLAANIITVTLASVLLAFYDWRMAAALFAALALVVLSKGFQGKFGARHVAAKLDAAERTQEYFEGIKVVKAFGLSGEKAEALRRSFRAMRDESLKFEVAAGVFIVSSAMILQTGIGLVTFVGVSLLSGGALDPVKLLFFILISAKIYSPLILLLTILPELLTGKNSVISCTAPRITASKTLIPPS
jgi:ATP-binding cassette subfamily B protein